MAVSPNRRRLAAAHGDHTIRIYDLATGKEVQTCVGHPRTPWCLQFHPVHDHIIASGCLAGEVSCSTLQHFQTKCSPSTENHCYM